MNERDPQQTGGADGTSSDEGARSTEGTASHEEAPSTEGTAEDEGRLQTLNQLYQELEAELERDVDETGPTGH